MFGDKRSSSLHLRDNSPDDERSVFDPVVNESS